MQIFIIFVESPLKSVHSDLLDKLVCKNSPVLCLKLYENEHELQKWLGKSKENENSMLGEGNVAFPM